MKIETENNCNLIFKQETNYQNQQVTGFWCATYAKNKFEYDICFDEQIFRSQNLEINWEGIKYVVNKIEAHIESLDKKSTNLCKAFYEEIFTKIDTDKFPFELSSIEIRGIQKVVTLENVYNFQILLDYFQIEDYNLTYSTKFSFNIDYFSLESIRRGNGYE